MTPLEFNKWRIVPRVLMFTYYGFFIFSFVWIVGWYMNYPFNEIEDQTIALAITGFPVAILTVLSGVLAVLTKSYWGDVGK